MSGETGAVESHFDSRPVSISDPSPLDLFFRSGVGRGPTTFACGPAAELTFAGLVLTTKTLYALKRT